MCRFSILLDPKLPDIRSHTIISNAGVLGISINSKFGQSPPSKSDCVASYLASNCNAIIPCAYYGFTLLGLAWSSTVSIEPGASIGCVFLCVRFEGVFRPMLCILARVID